MASADLDVAAALARSIRVKSLEMIHRAKSSHIGSSFSIAELLAVLYTNVLRVDPENPDWPGRDRLILSKGHACAALYVALAERKFFPASWLDDFYQDGARLAGHATHVGVPGVEVSTGSLGHGLPIGCGMALAAKRDRANYRIFVVLSDGECDEGSNWEAALFAPHHKLDNLTVIVDYNKIQSLGRVQEVLNLEPLSDKWRSFGWSVLEIDGHSLDEIANALAAVPKTSGTPTCVIAHTTKGKGVSFMEDQLLWHYRAPNKEEMAAAISDLGAQK